MIIIAYMPSVASDVTGILATIDNALSDSYDVSGDAMRWAPPTTAVTFIWDESHDANGSAMFTGVNVLDAESLRPGMTVWVDGNRYIIVAKTDDADQGLVFELEISLFIIAFQELQPFLVRRIPLISIAERHYRKRLEVLGTDTVLRAGIMPALLGRYQMPDIDMRAVAFSFIRPVILQQVNSRCLADPQFLFFHR
jgi:hypothetical protein